jgi:hypothetical protein
MARYVYNNRDRQAFTEWVLIGYDALPAKNKMALVATLLVAFFESEDN